MRGITKTVPQKEGRQAVDQLYDGSITEFEFHMRGKPSRLVEGDYVYTIYQDMLEGRCKVKEIILGVTNPVSGKVQTLIMVDCPGERLEPPVPKKGHRGTRYTEGEDWHSD